MRGRQAAASHSAELLRLVIDSATDFAFITLDQDRNVTSWSAGAGRLFGYAEDEVLGRKGDLIFTEEDRAAGAPDAEHAAAMLEGRAEDERWHVRKDGSLLWGSGLLLPLKTGQGFVKIMRDRTEHRLAEERRAESEERFRLLATNIPQLVFRSRSDGARTWGSPQWETFTGLSDEHSRAFGWLDAIHPDDRQATLDAWEWAQQAGEYSVEHRIRRSLDGAHRWHQTRARTSRMHQGAIEWVGTSTDVHDLRTLQDRQQVLISELQHRTGNLIAMVQGMAHQTLRRSDSLSDFAIEFESRLRALGRVQGLITSTPKQTLGIRPVIEAELRPHAEASRAIVIEGPPVELPVGTMQTLALAIHELATNAVKHGALKNPAGRLSVTWRVDTAESGGRRVEVVWREGGVVMPSGPSPRKGYGTELIMRALPYQLDAETKLEFGEDGVVCTIVLAL